jgi:hypothetical protein
MRDGGAEAMADIIERAVLTPVGTLRRKPPEGFGEAAESLTIRR